MPSNMSAPDTIILYPCSYNKRGEESLHSVQGVTADGEEVNIKLRVASKYAGREGTPSIAEFAREDYGAKNACIASPSNSPENRQGMLLFTGCEPDGENRKGITSYIARWAYRLVADADSPSPVMGIGRIDISEETSRNRGIRTDIEALQKAKPVGWEARVMRLEQDMQDATRFAYSLRIYHFSRTRIFTISDTKTWEQWITETINKGSGAGTITGIFVRAKQAGGKFLPEINAELVPIWNPKDRRYQNGQEIVSWLRKLNPDIVGLGEDVSLVAMPVECHVAGQVFKKFYGEPKNYQKLRQQYYPNGQAELSYLAASQSLHDGSPLLLRVHALGSPLGPAIKLNEHGDFIAHILGEAGDDPLEITEKIVTGLNFKAPISFPSWFEPIRAMIDEIDLPLAGDFSTEEPEPQPSATDSAQVPDSDFRYGIDPEMLDELVIVDDITEVASPLSATIDQQSEVVQATLEKDSGLAPEALPVDDQLPESDFSSGAILEQPSDNSEDQVTQIQESSSSPLAEPGKDDPEFNNPFDEPPVVQADASLGDDIEPDSDEPEMVWSEDSEEALEEPEPVIDEDSPLVNAPDIQADDEAIPPETPGVNPPDEIISRMDECSDRPSPEEEPQLPVGLGKQDEPDAPENVAIEVDKPVDKLEEHSAQEQDARQATSPVAAKPKGLSAFLAKRGLI